MIKKIFWVLNRCFSIFINSILNVFIKKKKYKILFGLKPEPYVNDLFIHNSKYLFLYLQNLEDYKTLWLCDDKYMLKEFKNRGIKNVASRKSIKGIWWILTAKYWVCDITANQITRFNSYNTKATVINLWHGIPLKKIGYDAINNLYDFKINSFQEKCYKFLKKEDDYYIVNCEFEQQCYHTAFSKTKNKIYILGSPRLDCLLKDVDNSDLFMKKDFNNVIKYKNSGKKLFVYMPTWRDTGKNISEWLTSKQFNSFLKENNITLICKLHPYDKNSINITSNDRIYIMKNDADIYPILKYSDALITDYSSIYFDYLLLDKPIIYYVPDLQEYQEQCRGFYRSYDELTAGLKTYNEDELILAMQGVINGVDNYKEDRKILRDKMFKYQDGKNCERVAEFIRSLDK